MGDSSKPITQLLREWRGGSSHARDELFDVVYDELKQLAERQLWRDNPNQTLQPTALVHELYLRFADQRTLAWRDRAHFFGISARLLRQILVDHARSTGAAKRGGNCVRISLDDAIASLADREIDVVLLDEALLKLSKRDSRQCEIVELRFFGGLSVEETAEVVGISPATVHREWAVARAWLYRAMAGAPDDLR